MASPSSDKVTPPGPSSAPRPRLKAGPLEPWTIREKLCLASAVRHNGDQNWVTVSRSMRPFLDPHRPTERFAPKNAALQYAALLEGVEPPKRVKRGDVKDAKETPEDIVVRKLTYQRIEELKRIVAAEQDRFMEFKRQQEMLRKGLLDEKLPEMWAEVTAKKRAAEEADAALKFANEEAARAAQDALLIRESSSPVTSPSASLAAAAASAAAASPPPPTSVPSAASVCAALLEEAETESVLAAAVVVSASSTDRQSNRKSTEDVDGSFNAATKVASSPSKPKSSLVTKLLLSTDTFFVAPRSEPVVVADTAVVPSADEVSEAKKDDPTAPSPKKEPPIKEEEAKREEEEEEEKSAVESCSSQTAKAEPTPSLEAEEKTEKEEVPAASSFLPSEANTEDAAEEPATTSIQSQSTEVSTASSAPSTSQGAEPFILPDISESEDVSDGGFLAEEEEEEEEEEVGRGGAPVPKISAGPEVTLEDIENHRKIDKLTAPSTKKEAKKESKDLTSAASLDEDVAAAEIAAEREEKKTPERQEAAAEEEEEDVVSKGGEGGGADADDDHLEQRILEDSESEAEAEMEASSDVHDPKARSIVSGATPSESETEDTMSNAASPRGDGRGRLRHAGSDIGSSIAGPLSSCPNSPASISQSSDIEADEKAHRAWKKSIMLVWRNASHHKYANLFLNPVTDEIAPGYSVVIKRPIDLKTIKSKVDNGQISSTAEFQRDFMLMFTNAIMYNNSDQDIFAMTNEMYRDVLEEIEQFMSTQLMVQAALASSNASDSASSPALAPSSSRLRGRQSRSQRQQESASSSVTGEEASTESDAKSGGQSSSLAAKRKNDESNTKAKKRRSHRVD